MIDPVTIGAAFALAKTSVGFVKEAINLGHEIKDCYDDLSKFFKAQGQIEKAAKEGKGAAQLDGRMIAAASARMAENIVNINKLIEGK